MVQHGSILNVSDKSGVVIVQCIKVFGGSNKRIAFLGDIILVVVKKISSLHKTRIKLGTRKRRRFVEGGLSRALLVRTKSNFCRLPGLFIKFNENAVVLISKKGIPVSKRAYGPILRELCIKRPSLGYISRFII
jgi:large subunit ribosomal protein L14